VLSGGAGKWISVMKLVSLWEKCCQEEGSALCFPVVVLKCPHKTDEVGREKKVLDFQYKTGSRENLLQKGSACRMGKMPRLQTSIKRGNVWPRGKPKGHRGETIRGLDANRC